MKNTTILKDELGLLKADKSAVINELRTLGDELRAIHNKIESAEKVLADIHNETLLETARRDDVHGRAVLLSTQLSKLKQELNTLTIKTEAARNRNAQDEKLHLGRIKELVEEEAGLESSISSLKKTYDKNMAALNNNLSEASAEFRAVKEQLGYVEEQRNTASIELAKIIGEEKKVIKERLKREDKVRAREKSLEMRERGLRKREEDIQTMASDLTILYYRFKEAYPDIDIDRLITKAT